jgi:hypothetical protein
MKLIKNYQQFNESVANKITESFTITLDQLPSIGDIVDKVNWKEGEKIAFIDFKGIKNIPVQITNGSDIVEPDTLENA